MLKIRLLIGYIFIQVLYLDFLIVDIFSRSLFSNCEITASKLDILAAHEERHLQLRSKTYRIESHSVQFSTRHYTLFGLYHSKANVSVDLLNSFVLVD